MRLGLEKFYALPSTMSMHGSPLSFAKNAKAYYLAEQVDTALEAIPVNTPRTEKQVAAVKARNAKRQRDVAEMRKELRWARQEVARLKMENRQLRLIGRPTQG